MSKKLTIGEYLGLNCKKVLENVNITEYKRVYRDISISCKKQCLGLLKNKFTFLQHVFSAGKKKLIQRKICGVSLGSDR